MQLTSNFPTNVCGTTLQMMLNFYLWPVHLKVLPHDNSNPSPRALHCQYTLSWAPFNFAENTLVIQHSSNIIAVHTCWRYQVTLISTDVTVRWRDIWFLIMELRQHLTSYTEQVRVPCTGQETLETSTVLELVLVEHKLTEPSQVSSIAYATKILCLC